MVHLERKGCYGVVETTYKIKILYFLLTKNNTGKMARAQGKHGEFGINWSVATLSNDIFFLCYAIIITF